MTKVAVALILSCMAWMAWPYYALYDLVSGVQSVDQEALERRVDWQAVRQGLRDDMNAMFLKKTARDVRTEPDKSGGALGAGIAALLGPAIIDRAIDAYVTPAGIAAIMKAGKPTSDHEVLQKSDRGVMPSSTALLSTEFDASRIKYAFFSRSPIAFRVEVAPPDGSSLRGNVRFLLRWDGDWRVSRISLPDDIFEQAERVMEPLSKFSAPLPADMQRR